MQVSVVDVPLLALIGVFSAYVYKHWLHDRNKDWFVFLTVSVVGLFWVDVVAANILQAKPWLVAPAATVPAAVGVFYVLSYPLWFKWSARMLFLLIGSNPREGGLLWVFTVEDRTENFEPAWRDEED